MGPTPLPARAPHLVDRALRRGTEKVPRRAVRSTEEAPTRRRHRIHRPVVHHGRKLTTQRSSTSYQGSTRTNTFDSWTSRGQTSPSGRETGEARTRLTRCLHGPWKRRPTPLPARAPHLVDRALRRGTEKVPRRAVCTTEEAPTRPRHRIHRPVVHHGRN